MTFVSLRIAAATATVVAFTPSTVVAFVAPTHAATRRTRTPNTAISVTTDKSPTSWDECDVLVLGSGPAARAIAALLASPGAGEKNNDNNGVAAATRAAAAGAGLDVLLADANYDRRWPPNYGVWEDEWESIRSMYAESFNQPLGNSCIERTWSVTDCYFGGSFDIPVTERLRLDRPYCRVDRDALRRTLSPASELMDGDGDAAVASGDEGNARYRVTRSSHMSRATSTNIYTPAGSLVHDESGSTVLLESKDHTTITQVRTKLVVDCTGHESRIVLKDDRIKSTPPGYQIAYGCLVKVDETSIPNRNYVGPYDKKAMTLFDYRTDHFLPNSQELSKAEFAPTFMYAMPLGDTSNRIFFEETSLVARPALSFMECKERCMTRLAHLGITVTDIEEEEYCYIPMGGPLPVKDQRVVGFGGAAAMVHPSTGYHLCRAMMGAGAVARVIRDELSNAEVRGWNPDRAAARAYNAIWSPSNIAQRNFAVFGGEYLMKQNVVGLRGFFGGFFKLPLSMWGGFLAGWPGLPYNANHENWTARLIYGLTFVSKLPPSVALDMIGSIIAYSITEGVTLPQSVTPFFGLPDGYEYKEKALVVGDVAAKMEARRMIEDAKIEEVVPVAFEEIPRSRELVR